MQSEKDEIDQLTTDEAGTDSKKLSKGQLKKLKQKKKDDTDDVEPEPTTPTPQTNGTTQPAETEEPASTAQEEDDKADQADGKKELSKGQLKKLKEKEKEKAKKEGKGEPTQPAAKPTQVVEEEKEEEEPEGKGADKKAKKGAKKPMNAAAKIALQRLEEQRKYEEERKRQEEELRKKDEEERLKQEEEDRKTKEAEEARRKEKEKWKQDLMDRGEYKSKKELEREVAIQRRREELVAQGIVAADHFDQQKTGPTDKPKSKAVRTKKQKPKKETETQQENHDSEKEENKNEEENEKNENFDNWEQELEGDQDRKTEEQDGDDWEKDFEKTTKVQTTDAKTAKDDKSTFKTDKKSEATVKSEDKAKSASRNEDGFRRAQPEPVPSVKSQEAAKEEIKAHEEDKKKDKNAKPQKVEDKSSGPAPELRSPIVCILGHVDTGKTKLLDKMRNTNVQEGEAGGITQQIGATYFPYEKLTMEIAKVEPVFPVDVKVPGLLIIDTPGHESFSNLRSRGSGLCDIAILVIDIMHGLEKQTLESIELLKFRKTPFIIALNKIDRIYGWKPRPDSSSNISLKKQDKNPQLEFKDRSKGIITELTEKGFNVAMYYENPDPNTYVSIIPTSAHTGEGISDLMALAVNYSQKWLKKKITRKDEFKCTVLEVKVIEGLGASIDVMLVDGFLTEGDRIVIAGYEGPIVTHVRALLTPHPMKEMRVKNEYIHHKTIQGAMGIKISANDLDKALAGSELYIARNDEEEEIYKRLSEEEIVKVKKSIKLVEEGVLVAASTLGSLEALLQFLKSSHIPVSNISIGPVSKAEVIKAMKPLQITEGEIKKEFATILAFDVKILNDAKDLAEQESVKIFTANIIYHLFDHFTAYMNDIREEKKRNEGKLAVFPVVLKPVAFFNMKDPIVMGVDVTEGSLRIGTPLCVVEKGKVRIGAIESMEKEHKPLQVARPSDGSIAVKIKGDSTIMAGRHFELKDRLVSVLSRESIDALKKYFRDEMSKNDWELVKKMKPLFNIV